MDEKKYCSRCGHELPEGAAYCPNCGEKVDTDYTSSFESRDRSGAFRDTYDQEYSPKKDDTTDEALPLAFGILSFFSGGLIFGILAIYFANKNPGGKYSSVGKTLGIISIALYAVAVFIFVLYAILIRASYVY